MTQPRTDLYTATHKGLRHAMYETGALLERTNFADANEKARAVDSAARTLGFFDEHLELENNFIAPLIREVAPEEVASELFGQHEDHVELSSAMKEVFSELKQASGAAALGLGFELCKLFNVMVAEQSHHMNKEERDGNTALWEAFSDEELIQVRTELQASIPPPRLGEWLALMLPNLNHQELVGMLGAMKASAPPEAFARVSKMAEELLGDRWAAIRAALPA